MGVRGDLSLHIYIYKYSRRSIPSKVNRVSKAPRQGAHSVKTRTVDRVMAKPAIGLSEAGGL